jgi:hypothetical protein
LDCNALVKSGDAAIIKAAKKINFTPAVKDGKPVGRFVRIEYNFNLY